MSARGQTRGPNILSRSEFDIVLGPFISSCDLIEGSYRNSEA